MSEPRRITIDTLRDLLERYVTLPPEQWELFRDRLEERVLPRNRHLIQIGQVSGELAFLTCGLVRRYTVLDGREVNTAFLCEGSFAGAFTSFVAQRPSDVAIQALEDTRILTLTYSAMRELGAGHSCWQQFGLQAAAGKLRRETEREATLLGLSAEERYRRLVTAWPAVELRVPQYHIASYLGVAPETLSRIRSRLSRES